MMMPVLRMVERLLAVVFAGEFVPGGPGDEDGNGPRVGPTEEAELPITLANQELDNSNWRGGAIVVELRRADQKFRDRADQRPATFESLYRSLVRDYIRRLVCVFQSKSFHADVIDRGIFETSITGVFDRDFALSIMRSCGWVSP